MKIVVVGGGPAGIAACLALAPRHDVVVFDPNGLGGNVASIGLFYIHRSPLFDSALRAWKVPHEVADVKAGMMLDGRVLSFDEVEQRYGSERFRSFVLHHYIKTRRSTYGFHHTAMNAAGKAGKQKYELDFRRLATAVQRRVRVLMTPVEREGLDLQGRSVLVPGFKRETFDAIVLTLPLPILYRVLGVGNPPVLRATDAYTTFVKTVGGNDIGHWDYVYTPFTPGNSVYRVSPVEATGTFAVESVETGRGLYIDVQAVFGADASFASRPVHVRGAHVFGEAPLPELPPDVLLLGRFAQWEPRMTMDKALARVTAWRDERGL